MLHQKEMEPWQSSFTRNLSDIVRLISVNVTIKGQNVISSDMTENCKNAERKSKMAKKHNRKWNRT